LTVAKPAKPVKLEPGKWHTYDIKAIGSIITVAVDGTKLYEFDLSKATKPTFNPDGTRNILPVALNDLPKKRKDRNPRLAWPVGIPEFPDQGAVGKFSRGAWRAGAQAEPPQQSWHSPHHSADSLANYFPMKKSRLSQILAAIFLSSPMLFAADPAPTPAAGITEGGRKTGERKAEGGKIFLTANGANGREYLEG